jgi:hypothetical protein
VGLVQIFEVPFCMRCLEVILSPRSMMSLVRPVHCLAYLTNVEPRSYRPWFLCKRKRTS